MGPFTSIAIYLTLWWTVLFAVLPLGNCQILSGVAVMMQ